MALNDDFWRQILTNQVPTNKYNSPYKCCDLTKRRLTKAERFARAALWYDWATLAWLNQHTCTVSSHAFNSQTFKSRVSDPRTIAHSHLSTLLNISNLPGAGPTSKMPFDSLNLPGAGPTFPDRTLENWPTIAYFYFKSDIYCDSDIYLLRIYL